MGVAQTLNGDGYWDFDSMRKQPENITTKFTLCVLQSVPQIAFIECNSQLVTIFPQKKGILQFLIISLEKVIFLNEARAFFHHKKRNLYSNKSPTDIMVPYLVEYYYVNTQYGNIFAHMYKYQELNNKLYSKFGYSPI